MAPSSAVANDKLSASIRNCCDILKPYLWLVDAYILDFFAEDLWRKLPLSWQHAMTDPDFTQLGSWLDMSQVPRYSSPWPLSLLALRATVHGLCLPRRTNNATRVCAHSHLLSDGGSATRLRHAFHKHVSLKKRHEIFKMANAVCRQASETGVSFVVDVGSGVGHLARLLAFGHGLRVCCIEAQDTLTWTARKLDEEIEMCLSKIIPKDQLKKLSCPVHVTAHLGPDVGKSDFNLLVSQAFQQIESPPDLCQSSFEFGIVGLHPCGDLAPYLMRMFVDSPEARFLCIAGCCYMKLTPDIGFPLSSMSNDANSPWPRDMHLSYEAREMACHAIEAYSHNLLSGNLSSLKIHCYRATLESIILKNWPNFRRTGMKSIKYDGQMKFPEYARRVLLAADLTPPEEDIVSQQTNECLGYWAQVVCFYSLRLMFAPVVETLILLDRWLFLSLKGCTCQVNPEFDPEVSPRNHLLIAAKPGKVS